MSARRFLLLAMAFALGLIGLLLLLPATRKGVGDLSVNFVGVTNGGTGARLAQFRVANHFSRRVRFGVCEVQVYQTNGWPGWLRDAGGGAWRAVAAGGELIFSVPVPHLEEALWRVPLSYQEDLSFIDDLRFRIDGLIWAIPRWRPEKPAPVRNGGSGFHRILFTYSPEMLGVSNSVVQQPEASCSAAQTNSSPVPAGFRR
jgi:hypothetical protein